MGRQQYMVVEDSNAYRSTNAPQGLVNAIKSMNNNKDSIKCIAIGENGSYFISNTNGGAKWAHNKEGFEEKIREIDCSKIKQLSFGPNGTYAIVMDNGFCHHRTQGASNNDGPWQKIEQWQNNIQSVAMTANSKEWIVVSKGDGWSSMGMKDNMTTYLQGVVAGSSSAAVECCQLGRDADSWLVEARAGTYRYVLSSSEAHESFKSRTSGSRLRAFW